MERWNFQDNTRYKSGGWKTNQYSITARKPGVHGTTLANIPNRATVPDEEKRANAILMAHAPELLAMLIELTDMEGPQPGTSTWGRNALALIARAQGNASFLPPKRNPHD
jgi:hypothetical protein